MKKKFFMLLLVVLFVVLLGIFSVCYASIDYTNFKQVSYTDTKENLFYTICDNTFGTHNFNQHSNWVGDYNNLLTDLRGTSYHYGYFEQSTSNGGQLSIYLNSNNSFNGGLTHVYSLYIQSMGYLVCNRSVYNGNIYSINGNLTNTIINKYLYVNDDYYIAKNNINGLIQPLSFIPNGVSVSMSYNNSTFSPVYKNSFARSISTVKIGQLRNYSDCYTIWGYVDVFIGTDASGDSISDNIGSCYWVYPRSNWLNT